MRIMSLLDMLTELRYEARISGDVAHGSHLQQRHIALLRRVQEEVYSAYEWPWLRATATVTLAPGQRYAALPAGFSQDGLNRVFAKTEKGEWVPVSYGIGADELNVYDSDADVRATDVERWATYSPATADPVPTNMLEFWPIPNRTVDLRLEGKRALAPLVDPNTDKSTLDGIIVVLHAAAEILAGQKAEDASMKLQLAQRRHDLLKMQQARHRPQVNLAG